MAVNEKVGIELEVKTGSLKSQLREATQELARLQESGTATAAEIAKAGKRAGELKERLSDVRAQIDAFNPEAKFKAFSAVVQGGAGAFSAAQGAMALLGIEGEDVQKTLLKVQGALALSEGLNTILSLEDGFKNLSLVVKSSSTYMAANAAITGLAGKTFKLLGLEVETSAVSFRVLKTAIAATGIGLLVVGLGMAVEAFQKYSNSAKDAADKQKELNEQIDKGAKSQLEGEKASLKRQEELEVAKAKRRGATEAEIYAIQDKYARLNIKSQERYYNEVKNIAKVGDEADKELKNLKAQRDTNLINNQTALILKAREKAKQERDENLKKELEDEKNRLEAIRKVSEDARAEYEKNQARIRSEDDDLKNRNADKFLSDQEKEIEATQAKYDKLYEERLKFGGDTLTVEEARREELAKIQDKYDQESLDKMSATSEEIIQSNRATAQMQTEDEKKEAFKRIRISEAERKAKLDNVKAAADVFGALSSLAEQGTETQKALSLAQVALNTGIAISNLVATSSAPTADNVLTGGISGFAKYALGIVQILSNIAQAKSIIDSVPGGGGGGSALSSIGSVAPPPMAPRPEASVPTELGASSLNTISNVVARAYVVESDITGSQQRINRIQNAARF